MDLGFFNSKVYIWRQIQTQSTFFCTWDRLKHSAQQNGLVMSQLTPSGVEVGSRYRLTCHSHSYVLNVAPKYPRVRETICQEPPDYMTNWTYAKWLEGTAKTRSFLKSPIQIMNL